MFAKVISMSTGVEKVGYQGRWSARRSPKSLMVLQHEIMDHEPTPAQDPHGEKQPGEELLRKDSTPFACLSKDLWRRTPMIDGDGYDDDDDDDDDDDNDDDGDDDDGGHADDDDDDGDG